MWFETRRGRWWWSIAGVVRGSPGDLGGVRGAGGVVGAADGLDSRRRRGGVDPVGAGDGWGWQHDGGGGVDGGAASTWRLKRSAGVSWRGPGHDAADPGWTVLGSIRPVDRNDRRLSPYGPFMRVRATRADSRTGGVRFRVSSQGTSRRCSVEARPGVRAVQRAASVIERSSRSSGNGVSVEPTRSVGGVTVRSGRPSTLVAGWLQCSLSDSKMQACRTC